MQPHHAYLRQRETGMSRIDQILAVYDGILDLLARAPHAEPTAARTILAKCRLALQALGSGISPDAGDWAVNFLKLYEFAEHGLTVATPEKIEAVAGVLRTLREGFEAIRDEALSLERQGQIPSLHNSHQLQAVI